MTCTWRRAPLETVVREAAEPHLERGKTVTFDVVALSDTDNNQPQIPRRPEIIHGLRNLIQNAVDFADSDVKIKVSWDADMLYLRISDDGAGFPASVIGRIGDPFVRRRRLTQDRPGYEGMGLGLFIAKTLLERSGAQLTFSNSRPKHSASQASQGAIVTVSWPRSHPAIALSRETAALGENQQIS